MNVEIEIGPFLLALLCVLALLVSGLLRTFGRFVAREIEADRKERAENARRREIAERREKERSGSE